MRDRYEPPTDPQPWPAFGPAHPVRGAGDPRARPPRTTRRRNITTGQRPPRHRPRPPRHRPRPPRPPPRRLLLLPWPRPPRRRPRPRPARRPRRRPPPGPFRHEGRAGRGHRRPHVLRPWHLRLAARRRPPRPGTRVRTAGRRTARGGHGLLTLPPGFRAVAGQPCPRPPGRDRPAADTGPGHGPGRPPGPRP